MELAYGWVEGGGRNAPSASMAGIYVYGSGYGTDEFTRKAVQRNDRRSLLDGGNDVITPGVW